MTSQNTDFILFNQHTFVLLLTTSAFVINVSNSWIDVFNDFVFKYATKKDVEVAFKKYGILQWTFCVNLYRISKVFSASGSVLLILGLAHLTYITLITQCVHPMLVRKLQTVTRVGLEPPTCSFLVQTS